MGGEEGVDDGREGTAVRHPPEAMSFVRIVDVGDGNAPGFMAATICSDSDGFTRTSWAPAR